MPTPYRRERPYPGKYRKLEDVAADNQLIEVYCSGCRRLVRYLATDLIEFFDERRDVMEPPFPCSRCGSDSRMRVNVISPDAGDFGSLIVRRPGPVIYTQTWRWTKLGDP